MTEIKKIEALPEEQRNRVIQLASDAVRFLQVARHHRKRAKECLDKIDEIVERGREDAEHHKEQG